MVNYRDLLKSYMRHVGEEEGVYFLWNFDSGTEELDAIHEIAEELRDEV